MHFSLIDRVVEADGERLVAVKVVTAGEEYLQDHFPTFPVLPGVLMREALVQGGRLLLEGRSGGDGPWVLGGVRALKYGSFVRPGQLLRVEVSVVGEGAEGLEFKGRGSVVDTGAPLEGEHPVAVAGRFTLRRVRGGRRES